MLFQKHPEGLFAKDRNVSGVGIQVIPVLVVLAVVVDARRKQELALLGQELLDLRQYVAGLT